MTSKVALIAGSSQHGNALLASVDSNWVVAEYFTSWLSGLKLQLTNTTQIEIMKNGCFYIYFLQSGDELVRRAVSFSPYPDKNKREFQKPRNNSRRWKGSAYLVMQCQQWKSMSNFCPIYWFGHWSFAWKDLSD